MDKLDGYRQRPDDPEGPGVCEPDAVEQAGDLAMHQFAEAVAVCAKMFDGPVDQVVHLGIAQMIAINMAARKR